MLLFLAALFAGLIPLHFSVALPACHPYFNVFLVFFLRPTWRDGDRCKAVTRRRSPKVGRGVVVDTLAVGYTLKGLRRTEFDFSRPIVQPNGKVFFAKIEFCMLTQPNVMPIPRRRMR